MDNPKRDERDQEDISRRAHERYQERGGQHGDDQSDWFEAEREVRERNRGEDEEPNGSDVA